jgi:hypothetical protein
MTVKAAFRRAAAAALMAVSAGCATVGRKEINAESFLPPSGKICVSPEKIRDAKLPVEEYLRDLYLTAITSPGSEQAGLNGDIPEMCLDMGLNKKNGEVIRFGYIEGNQLSLNPARWIDNYTRAIAVNHELRHYWQDNAGLSEFREGNIPEAQRFAMNWVREVDARLSGVVFVFEKGKGGSPEYLAEIRRRDSSVVPLLEAFENSLRKNPEDRAAAMRAGFMASLKMNKLMESYADNVAEWIEKNDGGFDPFLDSFDLLNDQDLKKLDYMDEDLIRVIRNLYQDKTIRSKSARSAPGYF